MPHDARCGCDECVQSSHSDSLRHSQSRINAYRALSSSSLIALRFVQRTLWNSFQCAMHIKLKGEKNIHSPFIQARLIQFSLLSNYRGS